MERTPRASLLQRFDPLAITRVSLATLSGQLRDRWGLACSALSLPLLDVLLTAALARPAVGVRSVTSLAEEGASRLDRVALAAFFVGWAPKELGVDPRVFCIVGELQVLWSVVLSGAIDVVDEFAAFQGPAEDLFHNQPVLQDGLAGDREYAVAVRDASSVLPWKYSVGVSCLAPTLPVFAAPAAGDRGAITGGDGTFACSH